MLVFEFIQIDMHYALHNEPVMFAFHTNLLKNANQSLMMAVAVAHDDDHHHHHHHHE